MVTSNDLIQFSNLLLTSPTAVELRKNSRASVRLKFNAIKLQVAEMELKGFSRMHTNKGALQYSEFINACNYYFKCKTKTIENSIVFIQKPPVYALVNQDCIIANNLSFPTACQLKNDKQKKTTGDFSIVESI